MERLLVQRDYAYGCLVTRLGIVKKLEEENTEESEWSIQRYKTKFIPMAIAHIERINAEIDEFEEEEEEIRQLEEEENQLNQN